MQVFRQKSVLNRLFISDYGVNISVTLRKYYSLIRSKSIPFIESILNSSFFRFPNNN